MTFQNELVQYWSFLSSCQWTELTLNVWPVPRLWTPALFQPLLRFVLHLKVLEPQSQAGRVRPGMKGPQDPLKKGRQELNLNVKITEMFPEMILHGQNTVHFVNHGYKVSIKVKTGKQTSALGFIYLNIWLLTMQYFHNFIFSNRVQWRPHFGSEGGDNVNFNILLC